MSQLAFGQTCAYMPVVVAQDNDRYVSRYTLSVLIYLSFLSKNKLKIDKYLERKEVYCYSIHQVFYRHLPL